jgi:ubiquinone/menaquinone biosynthesis C-methylase UbiE
MNKYDIEKQKWDKKSFQILDDPEKLNTISRYEDFFCTGNILRPVDHFFDLRGKNSVLLDIGCGTGWTAMLLAQKFKEVHAVDISMVSIQVLLKRMKLNAISNIYPNVCNAEKLPFQDAFFDYVFGYAILHHVDLHTIVPEISRVLKEGGKAAFCEPFGHNPLINFYRFIKHNYIEEFKGTDKPITYNDKGIFQKYFSDVIFFESSFTSDKVSLLRPIESMILKYVPFSKKFASYITIMLKK